MPVFNGEPYLEPAIESVLAQTRGDFELVICDNASTDATQQICERYATLDGRIRYVRNLSNIGAARNFNRGFELSSGAYFRWLAADDLMAPTSLQACAAVLDADPGVVLATSAADIVDENGRRLRPYESPQALPHAAACDRFKAVQLQDPWCIAVYGLMRRDALARTSLMGSYSGSDSTLLAELSLHGRFHQVPDVLFSRRFHSKAYSFVTSEANVASFYAPQARPGATMRMRTWLHRLANARAAWRAPLAPGQRLRTIGHVARLCWWHRSAMARELVAALRPARTDG